MFSIARFVLNTHSIYFFRSNSNNALIFKYYADFCLMRGPNQVDGKKREKWNRANLIFMSVQGFSSFFMGLIRFERIQFCDFLFKQKLVFFLMRWRWNWVKSRRFTLIIPYYTYFCAIFFSSSPLLIIQCSLKVQRPGRRSGKDRSSAYSLCSCRGVEEGLGDLCVERWRRVRISGLLTKCTCSETFVCIIITTSNIDIIEWIFFSSVSLFPLLHSLPLFVSPYISQSRFVG